MITVWQWIFWCSLFFLFYSYIGYGIVLYIVVRIKRLFFPARPAAPPAFEPEVTFMVAAYNEASIMADKIRNTLGLDYPAAKLQILFVTDGSTDDTNRIISGFPQVKLLYEPGRNGKTMAVNRAMQHVTTPLVIFSDANTLLNSDAVRRIVQHFADPETGAVAGEKKIITNEDSEVEGVGEGAYWKYESLLKRLDSELYSVMGAAGELFAVRTGLYEAVPGNVILDDFIISFNINRKGYKVIYEPAAYASEAPSASLADEYKRKVRISAGGFQSIVMLADLFNCFKYPRITWQYVSHRVLRWTLAPLGLLTALISNAALVAAGSHPVYTWLLVAQLGFYGLALTGYWLALQQIKIKYFYIPFYFVFMNVAVYHGFARFLKKKQSAVWERSERRILAE